MKTIQITESNFDLLKFTMNVALEHHLRMLEILRSNGMASYAEEYRIEKYNKVVELINELGM